jgi:hypothetical protein
LELKAINKLIIDRIKDAQKELLKFNLPEKIRLNNFTYLSDTRLFINTHLSYCKKYYNNKRISEPYIERLELLISILKGRE